MKITLVRTFKGLIPYDVSDEAKLKKIPFDTALEYDISVPRNLKLHKKFFALLNLAFENQEEFVSAKTFRSAVIIGAGYYEEQQRLGGEISIEAKSISFAKMDEAEFQNLYNDVLNTIVKYFGWEKTNLEEALLAG